MDAPPPLEDVRPFVHVAGLLHDAGLHAPRVLQADAEQGFLLLTDLGDRLLLPALQAAEPAAADAAMRRALHTLLQWQQAVPAAQLPAWSEAQIRAELALFPQWCVQREYGQTWSPSQQEAWDAVVGQIVRQMAAQPQVAVHSDFMPRNLMLPADDEATATAGTLGVLDFQDAVCGPISYDLASLLRDAFIGWPEDQQLDWAVRWWQQARRAGLPVDEDFGEFWRALEWTGLQRHLRILGVFCRLKHRDGKPQYAQELPRFFGYATQVAARYRPLAPLLRLLEPLPGASVQTGWTF
jgi:aminoglycoside/choline kinase family phosphotransferase